MPANEQTWRDSKILHVVFGISALVMLVATMWMLAADHQREWKRYQRAFQKVETGTAQARIAQQNNEEYRLTLKSLENDLESAREEVPSEKDEREFETLVIEARENKVVPETSLVKLQNAYEALKKAPAKNRPEERQRFFKEADKFIVDARFREANALTDKKFKAADFDVARSQFELAVGNGAADDDLKKLEQQVEKVRSQVDERTLIVQKITTYRKDMEIVYAHMTAGETAAKKALAEHQQKLGSLDKALYERANNWGKELLTLPVIDAFGGPLKPDQIWLPKLTINNNFRDVARFDRCTTCHQAIDKTAPGSATQPGYEKRRLVALTIPVADAEPAKDAGGGDEKNPTGDKAAAAKEEKPAADTSIDAFVKQRYGVQLAELGMLNDDDVTVNVVRPESPAAKGGLMVGDVIITVGGGRVVDRTNALEFLAASIRNGKPQSIEVLRGLPNPYVSHPRLDLFVGSMSPHGKQVVGCTICHEGQGSATEFKWASHTPNGPGQADKWLKEHGWFNNHHWIFPMNPKRFAESSCLKCHHEVVELEPSEKFPDPPAPTLMAGYHTIRQYGCFGCHEINGFDGPNRRVGPDLRAEPNYSAAAQALLAVAKLDNEQQSWAHELAARPENQSARRSLLQSLKLAASGGDSSGGKDASDSKPEVSSTVRGLTSLLEDVESPGILRKVGPSLRHLASKVDYDFLYSWVRKPTDFRPTTRMPQFFGLTDHLDDGGVGLHQSEEFEPIEIRATVAYLLSKSQPFDYAEQSKGVTEEASAERGKKLFETRGCLACHQHADFPAAKMNQGPDLSNVGAKLQAGGNKQGSKWLYAWLKNPSQYHPRTLMPNLILDPITDADKKTSDPAADIAMYLLSSKKLVGEDKDWQPENIPSQQLTDQDRAALSKLAMEYLKTATSTMMAKVYLQEGIPQDRAGDFKGDEVELVGPMSDQKQLLYVGRRTISKYGCSGCHDIPGYEDVKPIGTGLADWGRKGADKLAFEQIAEYILKQHVHGNDAGHAAGEKETAHKEIDYVDLPGSQGYFLEKLMHHEREGFIWNKLRQPRSYDYKKTENKGYNERLRMPKFNLSEQQVEQVITFVLGLVSEPPATQYVYKPSPRRKAELDGQKLVEKFNCGGCHTLQMAKWNLAYHADDFADPPPLPDYAFLQPRPTPQQLKESEKVDPRGLMHASIDGLPVMSDETGQPLVFDEDGAPLEPDDKTSKRFYQFVLWDNALINGKVRQAGLQNLMIPETTIEKRYEPEGGYLARLIFPVVYHDEKAVNPNAKADEAWGWLPPPLMGEGRKVQSTWLHDFLLNPYPIRPATVLRMPKFNMSSAEAAALAAYFNATGGIDSPYNAQPRESGSLSADEAKQFGDALKIVTDNNFCIKCHLIGDFSPAGSDRAKGPHLDQVYKRLRADYMRDWIANPKRILPYTGMPVNIPFDKPVNQELFPGTSSEQLHGLVDLLSEYDRYTESQTKIKSMIKTAPPAAAAQN